ncbi:leucine-rich repeat-containing protein let-4-like isoform X2 [Culex quinquefasciatus]|uniref:leucine-rich repeat-containing protein let-4-like isoform X2 n=1 Tax=Culex quinquefasciatus TaxID=7176 RepID=UPI0018E32607|nr:leucine-rich repeat-containing protein let-4-like isoform X2 [Culex quinquefasciatus]
MLLLQLSLLLAAATSALTDQLNICQDEFSTKGGFIVHHTNCRDYEDDAALAGAHFDEDHDLWIRNGTIEDIGQLLNGSLYNISKLRISDMAEPGNSPIEVFPIDSGRFSTLELTNDGIAELRIPEADYRLTHLNVARNKLKVLGNVKELKVLKSLTFDGNELEHVSMDDFMEMPELFSISLAGNRIRTITAEQQIMIVKLRALDISDNQLSQLDVTQWKFPQLVSFYMHDNQLSKIVGLRGKFKNVWDISMGGTNRWDCAWFDKVLEYLKQDRKFAMKMFGDPLNCAEESRMEGFICCTNPVDDGENTV